MSHDRPAILGGEPVLARGIPFVRPVVPRFEDLELEMRQAVESGMLTKGRHLAAFEAALSEHLRAEHVVVVSSCTSGLMLTYQALGLSGEVVMPSFTFMATVSAAVWCGLTPVFADVDPETTNLDLESAAAAITPRTTAIVGVHNFGNPADIAGLRDLAREHDLKLIFDSAHGFGTLYEGTPVGAQADAHAFSMSPTKLLVAGEGGAVATNDGELAVRLRLAREYGNDGTYDSAFAGMNARMPELSAILGLHSLRQLEDNVRFRNSVADKYRDMLQKFPGLDFQKIRPQDRSSYKDFSIVVQEQAFGMSRDALVAALRAENIDTRNYYDPPAHRQTAYRKYAPDQDDGLPHTVTLAEGSVSLPIGKQVTDEALRSIGAAFERIHAHRDEIRETWSREQVASTAGRNG